MNGVVFTVQWCSSRAGTAGFSAHLVLLFFQHAHIFGDNLPNIVLFHVLPMSNYSNSYVAIATFHLLYRLTLTLVLLIKEFLLLELSFPSSQFSLNILCRLRLVCATWCFPHTLVKAFQRLRNGFFPDWTKYFRLINSLVIIGERGVNESIWKNTVVTFICSQNIMLDDNTIFLFFFCQ